METFKTTLQNCSRSLQVLQNYIQIGARLAKSSLPRSCYTHWNEVSDLHKALDNSISLLEIRDKAFETMSEITNPVSFPPSPQSEEDKSDMVDLVRFGLGPVSFVTARYLSVSSYLSATWALYDRLAVTNGKIIGTSRMMTLNGKNASKLFDGYFMSGAKLGQYEGGFSLDNVVEEKWRWPVFCSYKIRNMGFHDGFIVGNNPFFKFDDPVNGFRMSDDAENIIIKEFLGMKQDEEPTAEDRNERFPDSDLRAVLKQTQEQIDQLVGMLLTWGVNAFREQVLAFSEPDKAQVLALMDSPQF